VVMWVACKWIIFCLMISGSHSHIMSYCQTTIFVTILDAV